MDEDRLTDLDRENLNSPDFQHLNTREEDPDPDRVNHLAYILMALIVMVIFWFGSQ